MGLKYSFDLAIDSPERTVLHGKIIREKKFTEKLYRQWYSEFEDCLSRCPKGKLIELGSGGGFLKEIIPSVLTSDILELEGNDLCFSALDMPFEDHSVAAIFMIDTFHHIPDSAQFLKEVDRVLMPGGKMLMIEPANSIFGRFIYQNFHHEPFLPKAKDWTIPASGPMSGANGALPYIVFERDYERFKKEFPSLKRSKPRYRNPLLYLLSGGVSFKQLLPDFTYEFVSFFDNILPRFFPFFSMFVKIELTKER
jgi:SAM-dependent methyltransferase